MSQNLKENQCIVKDDNLNVAATDQSEADSCLEFTTQETTHEREYREEYEMLLINPKNSNQLESTLLTDGESTLRGLF